MNILIPIFKLVFCIALLYSAYTNLKKTIPLIEMIEFSFQRKYYFILIKDIIKLVVIVLLNITLLGISMTILFSLE